MGVASSTWESEKAGPEVELQHTGACLPGWGGPPDPGTAWAAGEPGPAPNIRLGVNQNSLGHVDGPNRPRTRDSDKSIWNRLTS